MIWNGQVGSVDEDESKKIYKRTDKQKDRPNAMRKTIQTLIINGQVCLNKNLYSSSPYVLQKNEIWTHWGIFQTIG